MNIEIKKIGITDVQADCIVNAANSALQAGGGVCGAIFRSAGYDFLTQACTRIGRCDEGSAVITPGFNLRAEYIIHAVGPRWNSGKYGEEQKLRSAYTSALQLAAEHGCASIAFPLISAGIFGYPMEQAWHAAISAVKQFQEQNGDTPRVIFTVIDDNIKAAGERILKELPTTSL